VVGRIYEGVRQMKIQSKALVAGPYYFGGQENYTLTKFESNKCATVLM
jgi:hypothetical protein